MRHLVHHHADPAVVRKAVDMAIAAYQERFPVARPTSRWIDDDHAEFDFSIRGMKVEGTIALLPGAISFEAQVPLVFRPFVGRALHVLEAEVKRWIERVQPHSFESVEE